MWMGLPLGTRGGFVVEHDFPADGEYVFSIRQFLFMGAGYVTKVDDRHEVILTIDGKRVFQDAFGGPEDLKYVDQQQAIAADDMQNRFNNIRVKVKAGVRRVGVTFIQRSLRAVGFSVAAHCGAAGDGTCAQHSRAHGVGAFQCHWCE